MPPKIKYTKADLLRAAFRLTRARGIGAVNARAIARELGCSTQPIFRAFHSMDDVTAEVLRMANDLYGSYITRSASRSNRPYLSSGLAYLAFAQEEPELFRLLYMNKRIGEDAADETSDPAKDFVLDLVMESTGLTREQATEFHRHLWIYTHGLASMIATRFITLDAGQAERLLRTQYRAVRALFGLPPVPDEP